MLRRLALAILAAPALAIAVAGVVSPLERLRVQWSAAPGAADDYLRSVESARDALDEEVIGFLSERPVDTSGGGAVELYYYMAQYALVPRLIEPGPTRRQVLFVDPRPGSLERLLARPGVELVASPAPGLAVVELEP